MVWKKKLRSSQYTFNSERVFLVATQPGKSIYSCLQTTKLGLTLGEVQERQSIYGRNEVIHEQKKNPFILFVRTFINPFIGVLTGTRHHILISGCIDGRSRRAGMGRESSSSRPWCCSVLSCVSGRNGEQVRLRIL